VKKQVAYESWRDNDNCAYKMRYYKDDDTWQYKIAQQKSEKIKSSGKITDVTQKIFKLIQDLRWVLCTLNGAQKIDENLQVDITTAHYII